MSDRDDCVRCGACCFSRLARYVPVTAVDLERMGPAALALVAPEGRHLAMNLEQGHCKALQVDAVRGGFYCQIYEERPQVCRDLGRGTPECKGEYLAKRHRARAALSAARGQLA